MNERSLSTLELPKILHRLAAHAAFSAGRELALGLEPAKDWDEVRSRLRGTTEARHLLELKPSLGLAGARDIRPLLRRATVGGRLEPDELLQVMGTIQSGRSLRANIVRLDDQVQLLADIAGQIVDCAHIERDIARCISERGEVIADASPALGRIRASLRSARDRIIERLNDVLNSATYRPMIQEPIVTQRDGRYVIPVKAEYKGRFRGIVHDQSASGATLFIEPLATVELNNRVRELEVAEEHEVDRILRELSDLIARAAVELEGNVIALAALDLALAKAKYANAIKAEEPELTRLQPRQDGDVLRLLNARHPMLAGQVVPITVWLGGEFDALVITGPNTGGKTVSLKTVGLLSAMAQCGLHIPADGGSRLPVFDQIFADIGDEQSIEQSLSTFSSHMRNVVDVLRDADSRSLVLLDELGAGTDPSEGSALAQAILDYLLQRGALIIGTTHYSELKAYAHSTPRVENASVEFDVETLSPTYKLSVGLPGRSNALAIAAHLGLPTEVIEAAQARVAPSDAAVERMLSEIHEERERAIEERLEAEQRRVDAERLKGRLAGRLDGIERERAAILAQAREDARQEAAREIETVREQLRAAVTALQPAQAPDRAALMAALREAERASRAVDERRAAEREKKSPPVEREAPTPKGPLRVGDLVMVATLNQEGELLSLPEGGEAEVQIGNFKLRVRRAELRRLGRARQEGPVYGAIDVDSRQAVPLEIEVRGWRAEEVPPVIDKYVHDAYLAGLPFVRIIHGKGSGILRRLVRQQLAGNPLVQSMHQPEEREGGEGVTVVELAK